MSYNQSPFYPQFNSNPPNTSNTKYYISASFSLLVVITVITLIVLVAKNILIIPGINSPTTTSNTPASNTPAPISSSLTTKQQLQQLCPVIPGANGMINVGNSASYNDFLFSACTGSGTCDSVNPDPVSQTLINTLSSGGSCGHWNQPEVNPVLTWDYVNKKWTSNLTNVANTRYPGAGYITGSSADNYAGTKGYGYASPSPYSCYSDCQKDPLCKEFVYDTNTCYQMNKPPSIPASFVNGKDSGAVSGVKQ